jgi:hypothetical protein
MRASQVLLLVVSGSLTACDIDLFGTDAGKLAGGYELKKVEAFKRFEYELLEAGKDKGEYVDEIGWQRPVIIVKFQNHGNWNVIDTRKNQDVSMSDEDRKTSPVYREIKVLSAGDAWRQLSAHRRLWR